MKGFYTVLGALTKSLRLPKKILNYFLKIPPIEKILDTPLAATNLVTIFWDNFFTWKQEFIMQTCSKKVRRTYLETITSFDYCVNKILQPKSFSNPLQ